MRFINSDLSCHKTPKIGSIGADDLEERDKIIELNLCAESEEVGEIYFGIDRLL
jgi:hypothetical protein